MGCRCPACSTPEGVVLRMDDDDLPDEDDKRFGASEKQGESFAGPLFTSGGSKNSFGIKPALSRAPAYRCAALRAGRPPHGVLPRIDAGCPGSGRLATFVKVSPSSRKTSTSLSTKFAT